MIEEWRVIEGYPNHEVSNTGKIKSLNYMNRGVESLLKLHPNCYGYNQINLCFNGKMKKFSVHRLVAKHFIGDIVNKCVMHLDDTPLNNNVSNLRIGTHTDNMRDARDKGRNFVGEKNVMAKLKESDVREIREIYGKGGISQEKLAKRFGVGQYVISQIMTEKTWKHVI